MQNTEGKCRMQNVECRVSTRKEAPKPSPLGKVARAVRVTDEVAMR